MILQERVKLLLFVLLSISLNSFSTNTKFYNISDTYGITSGCLLYTSDAADE